MLDGAFCIDEDRKLSDTQQQQSQVDNGEINACRDSGRKMIDRQPGTKRFYNLTSEYEKTAAGDHEDVSDSDESRLFVVNDGYSSDLSDMSSIHRHQNNLSTKRVLKTRQVLDSKRNSVVIDEYLSDTDLDSLRTSTRNEQRKKRSKSHRLMKDESKIYRENLFEKDDKDRKRRSWTDSGVSLSLSRTDQSRCGTFDHGVSIRNTEMENENQTHLEVPLRRRTASQLRKTSTEATKSFNRLSQITNRSSLTNVSILTTTSMTSLSSIISPSELEYISESESYSSSDDDILTDSLLRNLKHTPGGGSQLSMTSTASTIKADNENISATDPEKYIDMQLRLYQKQKQQTNKCQKQSHSRKRSNSLIQKFKSHFHKSKQQSPNRSSKDVSSEFSFEKVEKDSNQKYEVITTDFLKKLRDEESAPLDFYVDDVQYEDDLSDEDDENQSKDPLENFSSKPHNKEHKTFLGKFFKRTRSYSVSPQLEKKTPKSRFSRNSFRASTRSNPEMPSKEDNFSNVGRYTSMDNLNLKEGGHQQDSENYTPKMNRSETFSGAISYNHENRTMYDSNFNRNQLPTQSPTIMQKQCLGIPAHGSVTPKASSPDFSKESPIPPPSPTPSVFDLEKFQQVHMPLDRCNCEECMYADYLDYLEFQRFRRYYSQSCCGPCCMAPTDLPVSPHTPQMAPMRISPRHVHPEANIIAPLPVTKETEKQAKNLRTSIYESFV
ncbi:uro-adherence factor A-like isoform X2 [Clytia hemisphaerica]|uniref:Uncharacterized protein n=1 Tax=Clytia hemisphaerica TaxID=252671 RepID=A0A7M5VCB0_9CNID